MADLIRLKAVLAKTGRTRSPFYSDVSQGVFTKPVRLGGKRAVGWPLAECEALVQARIAGLSEEQIRELVRKLHDARKAVQQ